MVADLKQTITRLSEKARFLTQRYRVTVSEKEAALKIVEEQKALIDSQKKEIEQLKLQVEYLTIAATLSPKREDVELTRATITNLVREIDRCLADLND
jgi:hypothetical protein